MDALRVIPQVFFDLIARMVPGAVALFLSALAVPGSWPVLSNGIKSGPQVVQESGALWFVTLFLASYSVGQILAPLARALQSSIDRLLPKKGVVAHFYGTPEREALHPQAHFFREELGETYDEQHERSIWIWYDWLRVYVPGAGELVARIRAEYTMYSSLSVAFAIACVVRIPLLTFTTRDLTFLACMLALSALMAFRYRQTEYTFRQSVTNFYFVCRGAFDLRWKAPRATEAK